MLETLYSILNLYSILLFIALGIILIWVMLIVSELTLNKYYGYQRFNFPEHIIERSQMFQVR